MTRTRIVGRVDRRTGEKWNILQRRFLWGWRDVEREPVPQWARVQAGCLGSTDWRSPLIAAHPDAEIFTTGRT